MRFIELTNTENKTEYVDCSKIESMSRYESYNSCYTTICFSKDSYVRVYEKPEEILKRIEAEVV